jgi:hypothetical protein
MIRSVIHGVIGRITVLPLNPDPQKDHSEMLSFRPLQLDEGLACCLQPIVQ